MSVLFSYWPLLKLKTFISWVLFKHTAGNRLDNKKILFVDLFRRDLKRYEGAKLFLSDRLNAQNKYNHIRFLRSKINTIFFPFGTALLVPFQS